MTRRRLLNWLGLTLMAGTAGTVAATRPARSNPYYSGPASDHFDGVRFFNPGGEPPRGFGDLLRWQFGGGRSPWPGRWPSPHPLAKPEASVPDDSVVVTHVGHASFLIQTGGLNILADPVWSRRVSPVGFAGPTRVNDPGIAFDDLPPIDLVLVSHNHYDHLDEATLTRLAAKHRPLIVTPLGNDVIIRRTAPTAKVVTGDWGNVIEGPKGIRIHLEPCHHWSARGTRDRSMALWAAFVIEGPAGRIYHVGDTGFHEGWNYRLARERHGGFRLAILPVGAYEPRWFMKAQHQSPEEAVDGFRMCGARHAIGHHWGTFRLTNEAIHDPRDRLHAALDASGISREMFRAMLPGEVWSVPA